MVIRALIKLPFLVILGAGCAHLSFPPLRPVKVNPSCGLQPLSPALCEALARALEQSLGVTMMVEEAPFEDFLKGERGLGVRYRQGHRFGIWRSGHDLKGYNGGI